MDCTTPAIDGMTCGHCVRGVVAGLQQRSGVGATTPAAPHRTDT